jgi:hypothetical protein
VKGFRDRLRLIVAAASACLLSVSPSFGENMPVPCSAFARHAYGDWKVLAPVILDIDGRLLAPTVGTTFSAGSMVYGLKMSEVLDRKCRTGRPALSNARFRAKD